MKNYYHGNVRELKTGRACVVLTRTDYITRMTSQPFRQGQSLLEGMKGQHGGDRKRHDQGMPDKGILVNKGGLLDRHKREDAPLQDEESTI